MPKPIVLATAPINEYCRSILGNFGEIRVAADTSASAFRASMDNVVAMVVRGPAPVTREVIANAPSLRVIGRTGVGYETIDIGAATDHSIPVIYTPGAGAQAVAEAALAFMLTLCKRIVFWDAQVKSGNWKARYEAQGGDLAGKTLGIVGFGRIGKIVAELARPFGMRVVAYDPLLSPADTVDHPVELLGLDELLEASDFVTLHCPQTPDTVGMINGERLSRMKPGSFLVNLSRGKIIESCDAVYDALASGRLAGVALDVFDPSPPDISHRLFSHPACLTSPHAVATTVGAMDRIFRSMTDDMAAVLTNSRPKHVVNPEVLNRRNPEPAKPEPVKS